MPRPWHVCTRVKFAWDSAVAKGIGGLRQGAIELTAKQEAVLEQG